MGVIAVIDQKEVIERILRYLGLWCGPDEAGARSPPREYLHEPWLEDSMPEYENVLTD